jgi:hypothetical protein
VPFVPACRLTRAALLGRVWSDAQGCCFLPKRVFSLVPTGSWSQHIFVDPAQPGDVYRSAYNCVGVSGWQAWSAHLVCGSARQTSGFAGLDRRRCGLQSTALLLVQNLLAQSCDHCRAHYGS